MEDSSEVGRYGVLRLMKRKEPNAAVTAFPIDNEEVTFGRDPKCSIRLYYPTVSAIHARIFFQESKVRSASIIFGGRVASRRNGRLVVMKVLRCHGSGTKTVPIVYHHGCTPYETSGAVYQSADTCKSRITTSALAGLDRKKLTPSTLYLR